MLIYVDHFWEERISDPIWTRVENIPSYGEGFTTKKSGWEAARTGASMGTSERSSEENCEAQLCEINPKMHWKRKYFRHRLSDDTSDSPLSSMYDGKATASMESALNMDWEYDFTISRTLKKKPDTYNTATAWSAPPNRHKLLVRVELEKKIRYSTRLRLRQLKPFCTNEIKCENQAEKMKRSGNTLGSELNL